MMLTPDQLQAATWARDILKTNPLVLDTETTGLDGTAEICQIAVIDFDGKTLLDSLVKPTRAIPPSATWIHHIDNDTVKSAPRWSSLCVKLSELLDGRTVVIYNASYDVKLMMQSHALSGAQENDWRTLATYHCAMLQYAAFFGDWNEYRGGWTWQALGRAVRQESIPEIDAPIHSALGDCLRTLALVKKMAEAAGEGVVTP